MKKVIGRLEIEYCFNKDNILKTTIREAGSSEWSCFKQVWRNLRHEHINYPHNWFYIVSRLREKFDNSEMIVEIYPSEAANIRGLIEDEIKLLEEENSDAIIYSKELSESGYTYRFLFNVESKKYFKKLINIYYAHQCMYIYLIPKNNINKFTKLLSEKQGSSLEKFLIKKYRDPFCLITTNIDMYILTNYFTIEDIAETINYEVHKSS